MMQDHNATKQVSFVLRLESAFAVQRDGGIGQHRAAWLVRRFRTKHDRSALNRNLPCVLSHPRIGSNHFGFERHGQDYAIAGLPLTLDREILSRLSAADTFSVYRDTRAPRPSRNSQVQGEIAGLRW